jgi:hypothetical protein
MPARDLRVVPIGWYPDGVLFFLDDLADAARCLESPRPACIREVFIHGHRDLGAEQRVAADQRPELPIGERDDDAEAGILVRRDERAR